MTISRDAPVVLVVTARFLSELQFPRGVLSTKDEWVRLVDLAEVISGVTPPNTGRSRKIKSGSSGRELLGTYCSTLIMKLTLMPTSPYSLVC